MPTIDVYPDVPRAYNRVEVNWADTTSVTHARVLRVDVESGTCTPLRPYICFDGDYLLLSCGHGVFWDTEVPLDRSVYYVTEALAGPCVPTNVLAGDQFGRILVDSWGSTEYGSLGPLPYTLTGGTNPGNYDVNGLEGTHTLDSTNVFRYSTIDIGSPDFDVYATTYSPVLTTGAPITLRIAGRFTNVNNTYLGGLIFETSGGLTWQIASLVGGVGTLLASATTATYVPNQRWRIRFQGHRSTLRVKFWPLSETEPETWDGEVINTGLTTGNMVGLSSRRDTGNTNGTQIIGWDDLLVIDECLPCEPVTATSEPSTMPSNGAFRLKDPVRPCNDIYMPLCFDQSNLASHRETGQYCAPGTGVFFASMETESYEPNTLTVNPTNARRPIAITRQRRDVSSNLTVVSRTFNDRDALLRLAAPGSPILLQGPPQYGIPDRYMDVGTVAVDRGLTDHRFQVRIVQMPHVAVDRPAGPQTGVCGSRVADLCDFTFDELAADGNTWEDLVRGRPTGGVSGFRTWDDVLAEFADWNDVNSGIRTWYDLEVGD